MACEFNLNFLKGLEREAVLEVLYRDQMVRKTEEERIRDMKVKAGEWFFEERAKKYPGEGRHETVGAKLLESYQNLSKISVVPPTPPPFTESAAGANVMGNMKSTPSLQQLVTGSQNDSETQSKSSCKEEDDMTTSPTSDTVFCDGRKHGSLYSLSSTCTESGNFGKANITGEIEFALKYNFRVCILEVCIKGCKNLAYGEEKKKKCNPYVKVYLLPDKSPQSKRKTAVKKSTVDPEFDETLKYKIEYSQLRSRQLQISVWHAGALKYRVFLGEVVIPLAAWNFEEDSMQFDWYPLKPKLEKPEDDLIQYSGELLVSVRLSVPAQYLNLQFEGNKDQGVLNCQLQVMIFGAKNLPMLRSAGMPNSFVKGHQMPLEGWYWGKLTSHETISPVEASTFEMEEFFGSMDLLSQGVLPWQEVLHNPNTWMDFPLVLHSNKENFKS
ncbi:synaptotagmin like 3 [Turdus rufiventris]|nr:synaptotagmin like 3 [Turdus rufiventris]